MQIRKTGTDLCMQPYSGPPRWGDGTSPALVLETCLSYEESQLFAVEAEADGFRLRHKDSNLCVEGGAGYDDVPVQLFECFGSDVEDWKRPAQRFRFGTVIPSPPVASGALRCSRMAVRGGGLLAS